MAGLLTREVARGQAGEVDGGIAGVVVDASGLPVPAAAVIATNSGTGFTRRLVTNTSGEYSLPLLPLGSYTLEVRKNGFARYVQSGVTVQANRITPLTVNLTVTDTSQVIQVTADAANVSTEPQAESYIPVQSLINLPNTARNPLNFALFTPAIASTQASGFGTPGIAFGGLLRREFIVDGVDDSQRAGGSKLLIYPAGAIQETSMIQGALLPEYGSTVGGLLLQTTRSGTNDFHGDLLDLERRPGLIARPSLAATKPFQERATREFSLGGPVIKDKWWFFGTFELNPQHTPVAITILPRYAAALGLPPSQLGSAPTFANNKYGLFRTDFQVNDRTSGFLRFNFGQSPSTYNGASPLSPLAANNNYYNQDMSSMFQLQTALSTGLLNEFRFGDNRRRNYQNPVSGQVGPVYTITGVATLNSNAIAGQYFGERQDEVVDNLSWTAGHHDLKFGFRFESVFNRLIDRLALNFTFGDPGIDAATRLPNSLLQYLRTASGVTPSGYTQLTQQFGNNTADFATKYLAFYAQDQWKIRPGLSINYGLRYDVPLYPSLDPGAPLPQSRSVPSDLSNVSPRIGLSWAPTPKMTLRGGYSILYDFTDLQFLGTALRSNGTRVLTYQVAGNAPGAPPFPTGFTAAPSISAVTPNAAGFAPDFRTYYAHQASAAFDRDLGSGFSVELGYLLYLGRRAPTFLNTNTGAPTGQLADGRPVFGGPRPVPSLGQIQLVESVGSSSYNGGYISLVRRFSRGLEFSANYTYSHAINNTDAATDTLASAAGLPSDPANLNFDRGAASADLRHRFTLQGVWQPALKANRWWSALANGWMVSPAVTLNTGFPVNVTAGLDLNKDGLLNDRPLFVARNSSRGPGNKELDLRLSRSFSLHDRFSLEIIAQAENLLNSTNPACSISSGCTGAVVSTAGAPDFLRITSANDSRQFELGARLRF